MNPLVINTTDALQTYNLNHIEEFYNKFTDRNILVGETSISQTWAATESQALLTMMVQAYLHQKAIVTVWGAGQFWPANYPILPWEWDGTNLIAKNAGIVFESFLATHPNQIAVNVAGLEFDGSSLETGQAYFNALAGKGVKIVRIPFRWERVQPTLGGALDATELGKLQNMVSYARNAGMHTIIIDMHNYGRYNDVAGEEIGGGTVTEAHYQDGWLKISAQINGSDINYDLMNEPTFISGTPAQAYNVLKNCKDALVAAGRTEKMWIESHNFAGVQDADDHPVSHEINSVHDYPESGNDGFGGGTYASNEATVAGNGSAATATFSFDNSNIPDLPDPPQPPGTGDRVNLVYNPSFENNTTDNVDFDNFLANPAVITNPTDPIAVAGNKILQIDIPANPLEPEAFRFKVRVNSDAKIPVTNGGVYAVSLYIDSSDTRDIQIALEGSTGGLYSGPITISPGMDRISAVLTSTQNIADSELRLIDINDGTAVTLRIDAVMVEELNTVEDYFDGDAGAEYSWAGTAHNSESQFVSTTAPLAPTGLATNSITETTIAVSWTDNATTETNYVVEQSTDGSVYTNATTLPANATSHTFTGLTAGTNYYLRVKATNANGDSAYETITAQTNTPAPTTAPADPTNLSATAVSSSEVVLNWTDNANNEDRYHIERGTTPSNYVEVAVIPANTGTYNDTGLDEATDYFYRVRASNG